MKKCPECGNKQSNVDLLSLTNSRYRFLCPKCDTVLQTEKSYLRSAAYIVMPAYGIYYLKDSLLFSINGLVVIFIFIASGIFLAFLYLNNMPIVKSLNQSKDQFDKKSKFLYKPPPVPIDNTLKSQFLSKFHHKSIQELESILSNPSIVDKAKEAATELLESRLNELKDNKSI